MMSIDEAIERINFASGRVGAILVFPDKGTENKSLTKADLQRLADGDLLKRHKDGKGYRAGTCSLQKNGYLKIKMEHPWLR